MSNILSFIKRETVLCVSGVLAVVSMFIVPPNSEYIGYIDFKTLSLLFCLMLVMAGLSKLGVFSNLADTLLKRTGTVRKISFVLVLLCFFSSMLVTNDVALITFVPFAIETLKKAEKKQHIISVVVLQTVAANLGSMLTPIGNPQNLYLYSLSGMSVVEFILLMLPYTLVSLAMIVISVLFIKNSGAEYVPDKTDTKIKKGLCGVYVILMIISVLAVAHIVPYYISLAIVFATVLIIDLKTIAKVDYSLLITFVFFFVFIGNMGRVGVFGDFINSIISGHEILSSLAVSQVVSNVPAAMLLSGFTDNVKGLIIGTNIGGLGTLIASMASLISYKYFVNFDNAGKGKYLLIFTAVNAVMLVVLFAVSVLI